MNRTALIVAVFLSGLLAGFVLGYGLSVRYGGTGEQATLKPKAVPLKLEFRGIEKRSVSGKWEAEAILDLCGEMFLLDSRASTPCAAVEELNYTLRCLGVEERVELACGGMQPPEKE